MNAALLSIGDELVLGENVDTNSGWLANELAQRGFITVEHRTVNDDRKAIAEAIGHLAGRAGVLIMTGGLGPTADDLTREGLRDAMDPGDALVIDRKAVEHLERWFERKGRSMPVTNQSQTMRPPSACIIPNPHGTAPGLAGTIGDCRVFALPGPPREMMPMFRDHVLPVIAEGASDEVLVVKTVSCFGLGEALAAERLGDLLAREREPQVGITASESIVTARVRCLGPRDKAGRAVDEIVAQVYERWHPYAYGSGDESLQQVIGNLLRRDRKTLATAESCTGGWLGKLIVDISGSSSYYRGGWVTYSDELKRKWLGVPTSIFDEGGPGAVSEPCAAAMARGALGESGSDYSLAVTGIAGPDGGTAEKPVGTVFIALGEHTGVDIETHVRRFEFSGDRSVIRHRATQTALQMLRLVLLRQEEPAPMLWEKTDSAGAVRG